MAKSLIVVAHPDDESFFFGGRMIWNSTEDFDVLVVTDGGAHDSNTPSDVAQRKEKLLCAARLFGFKVLPCEPLKDYFSKRLDFDALVALIQGATKGKVYDRVYTHSPVGDEMMHWHHQDVALAVSFIFREKALFRTYGLRTHGDSFEVFPGTYQRKIEFLSKAYPEETESFAQTFGYFTEERVCQLPFNFVWLLYAWHSDISFEGGLLNTHPDFSDTWNMRQSPYENEKLEKYVSALKTALSGAQCGVEFGAYLGLYSKAFLGAKIVTELNMVEVCEKHYPDLQPLGLVVPDVSALPKRVYDVAFFMEVVYYFSKEVSEKILSWFQENGLPRYLVFSNPKESTDMFLSALPGIAEKYKLVDSLEISGTYEYNFDRTEFLFKRQSTLLQVYEITAVR